MDKINLVQLLKNCPKGMELECILFDDVKFEKCSIAYVYIRRNNEELFALNKDGSLLEVANSKCIIFPKGKTTWEGFVPPCQFKNGDRIKDKNNREWFVGQVFETHFDISSVPNAEGYFVPIEDQDNYELVPDKFNITE